MGDIIIYAVLLFLAAINYGQTSALGKRQDKQSTDCKPVVMCPQFCLKVRGKCYVCDCGDSMNTYMSGAASKMQQSYQAPVYQTGSLFLNSQTGNGRSPMTLPTPSGGTGVSEFYRPVFGAIPGRCPVLDYRCPPSCWRTNTYSGCLECRCKGIGSPPKSTLPSTTVPTITKTIRTTESTTARTTPGTTTEITTNEPTSLNKTKLSQSTAELATSAPIRNTEENNKGQKAKPGEKLHLNLETLSSMSGIDLIKFLLNEMKKNQSMEQILTGIPHGNGEEKTTRVTETTTGTTAAIAITTPITTTAITVTTPITTTNTTTEAEQTTLNIQPSTTTEKKTGNGNDDCPPVDITCPSKCLVFDKLSQCTLCSCKEEHIEKENSTHECSDIDASCPPDCIAIDSFLCPVCTCAFSTTPVPETTRASPTTSGPATLGKSSSETVCRVDDSISGCSRDCLDFDEHFCPVCKCPKTTTTESWQGEFYCKPVPRTCPIKCIAVAENYCPLCTCDVDD